MPPPQDKELTLLGHLDELRLRLMHCFIALVPAMIVGYLCAPWVIRQITIPFEEASRTIAQARVAKFAVDRDGTLRLQGEGFPTGGKLDRVEFVDRESGEVLGYLGQDKGGIIYLSPMGPFMIMLKTAFAVGLVLAMPYLLWQAWAFVAPGLYRSERRFAVPFILSGCLLFVVGCGFAYFTMRFAVEFLAQFVQPGAYLYNDMGEYLSFVLYTMLGFGLVFELPLATLLATKAGLVRRETLAGQRRVVFVVLVFISAVITPSADPFTLLALAIPMYILFEASLLVSRLTEAPRVDALSDPDRPGAVAS